jgi:L-threonylcarbamoyladenylate synthase
MLRKIRLGTSKISIDKAVTETCTVLIKGGVILYPTDTLYGLGVDADNTDAVKKLYKIKNRDFDKGVPIIVSSIEMAEQYVVLNEKARIIAEKFWPGALTLILPKKGNNLSGIYAGETIGIRVPDNDFCLRLLNAFCGPITSTSANISGMKPQNSIEKILFQLGDKVRDIDVAIDSGIMSRDHPSTIIDLGLGKMKIIREGSVPSHKLRPNM